jgi:hypothetical protein
LRSTEDGIFFKEQTDFAEYKAFLYHQYLGKLFFFFMAKINRMTWAYEHDANGYTIIRQLKNLNISIGMYGGQPMIEEKDLMDGLALIQKNQTDRNIVRKQKAQERAKTRLQIFQLGYAVFKSEQGDKILAEAQAVVSASLEGNVQKV